MAQELILSAYLGCRLEANSAFDLRTCIVVTCSARLADDLMDPLHPQHEEEEEGEEQQLESLLAATKSEDEQQKTYEEGSREGHAIFFGHRGTSVAASVVAYGVALLVSTVDSCWIDGATTSRIKISELFPAADWLLQNANTMS